MGGVIGKAADGVGGVVGNAIVAPFKNIFGGSCEDVCLGPWDIVCFIENLCVSNLVKLLMILGLCYITLLFLYVLFKVGLCQCIARSLCRMCWTACETYWFAMEDITCFLWHKLKNTKRVNRRRQQRRRDIESGYSSSSSEWSDNQSQLSVSRKRKSVRNERNLHSSRRSHRYHRHIRSDTREVSVRVKGRPRRSRHSRQLQVGKMRNLPRDVRILKRQRVK